MLTKGTGVTAQVAAKSDKPGERALFLQFGPGRVDYREVTELIMLSPGSYQFQGKYKGDLVSERGLEWRVICAAKEQNVIGRGLVSRSTTAQWQDLEFSFTVPAADCPAQYVKLVFDARSASEKFISGNIWFDDFKIAREEPTVATQPTVMPAAPPGTPQPAEASGNAGAPGTTSEAPAPTAEPGVAPAVPPETAQPPAGTQRRRLRQKPLRHPQQRLNQVSRQRLHQKPLSPRYHLGQRRRRCLRQKRLRHPRQLLRQMSHRRLRQKPPSLQAAPQ